MEVILLERVDKQGEEGDIVDVSSGYARNYLIPNGLAKPATDENIQEVKQKKKQKQKQKNEQKQQARKKHSKLDGATINIQKPANEDGKLYACVGADDVVSAIKEFCGESIGADQVGFSSEIKTTGADEVSIELADDSTASVTLNIQPE